MELQPRSIHNYRAWLKEELCERTQKNSAYSLNAFSKFLGVSPASLSQIISGKRPLTRKTALKIIERCALGPEEARVFLASALGTEWGDQTTRPETDADPLYCELQMDAFRLISDWYHYAILSLGDIKPNDSNPTWIAERLGITVHEAQEGFDRLVRLKLIRRKGHGFHQCSKPLSVPTERSVEAIRKYHRQTLLRADHALAHGKAPLEYFSAITMAIDESRLPQARQLIKNFRRNLCQLVESGRREKVYTLAIQLFPVSKP